MALLTVFTSQRLRKGLTFALWLIGVVVAMGMLLGRPAGGLDGLAWSVPIQVSAPEDGLLLEMSVLLHEGVTAGQLISRMDPEPLLARAEVLHAELMALEYSESEDASGRTRRYELDLEDAKLERARLRASVAEEEVRLAAVEVELGRETRLVEEGLRAPAIAEDLSLQADVVRTRVEAERARLASAEQALVQTTVRASAAGGPNQWQLVAAEKRLEEVYQRLERLELSSPIDGQIVGLEGAKGEWLRAGEPVVRVSPIDTDVVHVWADARVASETSVGDQVSVRRTSGQRLEGSVLSVGVERQLLPVALWYRPNNQEWGYLVRIRLSAQRLPVGEPVRVSLR